MLSHSCSAPGGAQGICCPKKTDHQESSMDSGHCPQPLCIYTALHHPHLVWSPGAVGWEDFRGFLPQQKTEVLSTDLCDCWKCESSFSRISLLFFTCLCFTESLQKAQREARSSKELCDFLILSTPSGICRLCGLGHSTQHHPALSLSLIPISRKMQRAALSPHIPTALAKAK